MKKLSLLLVFCITVTSYAQQGINYKALIKDNLGNVVVSQTIDVQFIILEDVTNIYQETHTPTTDANGLIIVNIGQGTTSDVFTDIDWAADDHFLNVQIDTGSGLTDMGTTQFMAVPYALQAENAANVTGLEAIDEGNGIGWRLIGRNPYSYGDLGLNAIDLSLSSGISSVYGATGSSSIATGRSTTASGIFSTAMGWLTTALGDFSTAIGYSATSSGSSSLAMGYSTTSSGSVSTALGSTTIASGDYSTAMGIITKANSYASIALGKNNIGGGNPTTWVETDPLLELGNGDISNSNALTVLKNGTITAPSFDLAEITDDKALITKEYADTNLTASGLEAIIDNISTGYRIVGRNPNNYGDIGFNAVDFSFSNNSSATLGATGAYSLASGFKATASGASSNSLGSNTKAFGNYSTAIGQLTEASGESSTAMGYNTNAIGTSSTAMGSETSASASYATAMGIETDASGVASTAMGYNTTASSHNTTALGSSTIASGGISLAMGFRSEAIGEVSTAIGYDSAAESYIVTAIGRYNTGGGNPTSWISTDPLFEVGNGVDGNNRSNALTILKNGKIGIDKHTGINAKLDIDHASSQTSPQINIRETSGTYARLNFSNTSSSEYWAIAGSLNGTTSTDRINFYHSDVGDIMSILGSGNILVNGSTVHSSDRRLKKDIETIPYGLDEVLQLQPKAYNWNAKPDQEYQSLGLIAQEVQPIIKEIVHTAADEDKTLSVSYTELIPVLIKAIQEQQEIIDAQNSKLEQQDAKINGLTVELEQKEETQKSFNQRLEKLEAKTMLNNQ